MSVTVPSLPLLRIASGRRFPESSAAKNQPSRVVSS
jgi:hypothetical protein